MISILGFRLEITFSSRRFEKECNEYRLLVRKHGQDRAKRIHRRLDDLRAVESLEDMRNLPGRCHELTGNMAGQLSLDLDHPYRLILIPGADPPPMKPDGGIDWPHVESALITGVDDTPD